MKKMIVLSIALLFASLGWAQDQSAQPTTSTEASSSNTNPGSVQGCLGGSDGNFTLTQDSTGTVFKLAGSDDKLKKHVGHEVAVSGQMSGDSGSASAPRDQQGAPSSGNTDTNAADSSTIQVSDVKMVSAQCSSANNAPQGR